MLLAANLTAWYLGKYYLLKPIDVLIKGKFITISYLSRNLTEVIKVKEICFDNISRYTDHFDRDISFKIYFVNGKTISFYKSTFWNKKDDFVALICDFKTKIDRYNKVQLLNHKKEARNIKYGDKLYLIQLAVYSLGAILGCLKLIIHTCDIKTILSLIGIISISVLSLKIHKLI